jgi:hypothetical protein
MPEKRIYSAQTGTYYLWFAALVPVLLLIGSLVFFTNRQSLASKKIQSAVDTAALSGTQKFCSRNECFQQAREAAIIVLQQNLQSILPGIETVDFLCAYYNHADPVAAENRDCEGIESNYKGTLSFSEVPKDSDGEEEHVAWWNFVSADSKYKASIEINRVWAQPQSDDSAALSYESLEGNWQIGNPAVPRYAIGNSIRVRVEYEHSGNPLMSFFSDSGIKTLAEATAHIEPLGLNVTAVPFAIPLCSLVEPVKNLTGQVIDSELQDPEKICEGDRLFTEASRYCPEDKPDCQIIPEFFWDPADSTEPDMGQAPQSNQYGVWRSYKYTEVSDHFAVVGLASSSFDPDSSIVPTEEMIESRLQSILNSSSNPAALQLLNISVGDRFHILKNGLTKTEAEALVMANIIGSESKIYINDPQHPKYTETELKDYQRNMKQTPWNFFPQTPGAYTYDTYYGNYGAGHYFWDVGYGTCNSRRFHFPGERGTNMKAFELDEDNTYLKNFSNTIKSYVIPEPTPGVYGTAFEQTTPDPTSTPVSTEAPTTTPTPSGSIDPDASPSPMIPTPTPDLGYPIKSVLQTLDQIFAQYYYTMTSSDPNDTFVADVIQPYRSNPTNENLISSIQNSCFAFSYLYDFIASPLAIGNSIVGATGLINADTYKFFTKEMRLLSPDGDPRNATVWKVKVPVIAQFGANAKTCSGVKPVGEHDPADIPQKDPAIEFNANGSTKADFKVVGFVEVLFYDVDIGNPPPAYPHTKTDETDTTACDWSDPSFDSECRLCPIFWHGYSPYLSEHTTPAGYSWGFYGNNGYCMNGCYNNGNDTNSHYSNPYSHSYYGTNYNNPMEMVTGSFDQFRQANPITYPWGFTTNNVPDYSKYPGFAIDGNNGEPRNCNLIRAKISCGTDFIPSAVNSQNEERTRIVTLEK